MNKEFVPISIFFSVLMFLLFGFIILNMKDGIPLAFSDSDKRVLISKIELLDETPIIDEKASNTIFSNRNSSEFRKFSSEGELKDYLEKSNSFQDAFGGGFIKREMAFDAAVSSPSALGVSKEGVFESAGSAFAKRVSETNVQVSGIDEPDILKTNGESIYFSSQNYYRGGIVEIMPRVGIETDAIMPFYKNKASTKIINAFPPSDLKEESEIKESGNLLISENNLIIFSGNFIYAYDVKDSKNPKKKWDIELKNNNYLVQARLYNDKIYLITKKGIDRYNPCPIVPFAVKKEDIEISCKDIYHPNVIVPSDVTYSISTINADTGKMDMGISFLGSYDSKIYMSKNSLFVAYSYSSDPISFFYDFILENQDIFSKTILERIKTLKNYEISQNTKIIELQLALDKFKNSLNGDEVLVFENEMQNRMSSYIDKNKRKMQKTNIVKINLNDFKLNSIGTVPGVLLNQFSMDEYQDNLRIATTIGQQSFGFRSVIFRPQQAENDLYILDKNMNIVSSILGFGLDERIYSVRFLKDKAFIVTFRQIDPFFVMDLSNPKKPKITGELKIPGYSSYLHPINKDKILGIGKEGSKVKISLFDVSNPKNPKELAKYILNEYWSEVLNTHRAFLLDNKYKVFFIPGSKGAYIFSFKDDKLKLQKALSGISTKRALYLDNYFYIVGNTKIIVLDQLNWKKVNELKF